MEIKEFQIPDHIDFSNKSYKQYNSFKQIIDAVRKRELSDKSIEFINGEIELIQSLDGKEREQTKQVLKSRSKIKTMLEKEYKLVIKGHYQQTWMILGMTVFGVPIGVALSTPMNNYGFIGTGIPIGMVIGMTIGSSMDKKAKEEGRQLDFD